VISLDLAIDEAFAELAPNLSDLERAALRAWTHDAYRTRCARAGAPVTDDEIRTTATVAVSYALNRLTQGRWPEDLPC
jgi:hypothetical protein